MSAIETPADHAPETHFKRVLGLPALVAFGLAYMVPLTVWTTYGVVTTSTEGHLPAGVPGDDDRDAVHRLQLRADGRRPADRRLGLRLRLAGVRPAVGFMVGWALLLDYIFLPMINYLVIGLYMEDYFPSIHQPVWIVLTVLIVTGLNILGIRLLAGMNIVLVGAQFVFIVVFAVLAIGDITGEVEVQSFTAPFVDSGTDVGLDLRRRRDPRALVPRLRRGLDAVRGDRRPAPPDPQGDPAVRAGGRPRLHLPVLPRRTSPSPTTPRSRTTRTWPAPTS